MRRRQSFDWRALALLAALLGILVEWRMVYAMPMMTTTPRDYPKMDISSNVVATATTPTAIPAPATKTSASKFHRKRDFEDFTTESVRWIFMRSSLSTNSPLPLSSFSPTDSSYNNNYLLKHEQRNKMNPVQDVIKRAIVYNNEEIVQNKNKVSRDNRNDNDSESRNESNSSSKVSSSNESMNSEKYNQNTNKIFVAAKEVDHREQQQQKKENNSYFTYIKNNNQTDNSDRSNLNGRDNSSEVLKSQIFLAMNSSQEENYTSRRIKKSSLSNLRGKRKKLLHNHDHDYNYEKMLRAEETKEDERESTVVAASENSIINSNKNSISHRNNKSNIGVSTSSNSSGNNEENNSNKLIKLNAMSGPKAIETSGVESIGDDYNLIKNSNNSDKRNLSAITRVRTDTQKGDSSQSVSQFLSLLPPKIKTPTKATISTTTSSSSLSVLPSASLSSPALSSPNLPSSALFSTELSSVSHASPPNSLSSSTDSIQNVAILSTVERSIRSIDSEHSIRNPDSSGSTIVRRSLEDLTQENSNSRVNNSTSTTSNSDGQHNHHQHRHEHQQHRHHHHHHHHPHLRGLKTRRLNNSRNTTIISNNQNQNNNSNNSNNHNNHHHHQHPTHHNVYNNNRSNLDRNERSAISLLSGPTRKIQLYIKNRFIQILPDGTINGTQDDQSEYTILQRSTVDVGRIKVQSVATCLYLCMDQCGTVYGSKEFTDDCVFNENMEQHNYNTYSSTYNSNARRTYYLALNRHGEPRKLQIPPTRSLGKLATYTNAITETVPQERVEQLIAKNFGANRIKHGLRQLCDTGKPLIELIDSEHFKVRPQCNGSGSSSSGSSTNSNSYNSDNTNSSRNSNKNSSSNSSSSSNNNNSSSSSGQLMNSVPAANDRNRLVNTFSSSNDDSVSSHSNSKSDSNSSIKSSQNSNVGHISVSDSSDKDISNNNVSSSSSSRNSGSISSGSGLKKKKKKRKCRPHENEEEHNCHRGPQPLRKRLKHNNQNNNNNNNDSNHKKKHKKKRKCTKKQLQKQQQLQANITAGVISATANSTMASTFALNCVPKKPKKNGNNKKGGRPNGNNKNKKNMNALSDDDDNDELPKKRRGKKMPPKDRQNGGNRNVGGGGGGLGRNDANGNNGRDGSGRGSGKADANKKRNHNNQNMQNRQRNKQKKLIKTTTSTTSTSSASPSSLSARTTTSKTTLYEMMQIDTTTIRALPELTSSIYESLSLHGQTTSDRGDREQRNVHYTNSMELRAEGVGGNTVGNSMENSFSGEDDDVDNEHINSRSAEKADVDEEEVEEEEEDEEEEEEEDDDGDENEEEDEDEAGDENVESYEDNGQGSRTSHASPDGSAKQLTGGADDFLYYDQIDLLSGTLWQITSIFWLLRWTQQLLH